MKFAVRLAEEILDMQQIIIAQAQEIARLERYEHDYNELIKKSIDHSKQMLSGIMQIAMTPGVMTALSKANEQKDNG